MKTALEILNKYIDFKDDSSPNRGEIIKAMEEFKNQKRSTGVFLIELERQEQIEKHGWDLNHDKDYGKGELLKAACFCLNQEVFEWPFEWTYEHREKIFKKSRIDQLKVAGALIAAEIDRLSASARNDG